MAKTRYFNLKEKKNTNGMVIRVRPNAPLEKRVSEITGVPFNAELLYFNVKDYPGENIQYGVDITGNRVRKKTMNVAIDSQGNLCVLCGPSHRGVEPYVEEITAAKAKDMKEEAENWDLQRGYFDRGCS